MNYIKSLELEKRLLQEQVITARRQVEVLQDYFLSDKFQGLNNDYVHVRTDVLPKLAWIKSQLI